MEYKKYFEGLLEFQEMLHCYAFAEKNVKEQRYDEILNSKYLKEFYRIQTWLPLKGIVAEESREFSTNVYELKKDFFINMGMQNTFDGQNANRPAEMERYHRHNFFELVYVYRGTYVQYIHGVRHEHREGEFCLLDLNILHREGAIGENDIIFFLCMNKNYIESELKKELKAYKVIKDFIEKTELERIKKYAIFKPERKTEIEGIIEQILKENYEKTPGYYSLIRGYLVRLFWMLTEQCQVEIYNESKKTIDQQIMEELHGFMVENLAQVTRNSAAEFFYFNPDYLNRFIQKQTGKSYSDYVKNLRLEQAARRLSGSGDSIDKIISDLGVHNKSYFYRIFKEEYGVLPGEYRKKVT